MVIGSVLLVRSVYLFIYSTIAYSNVKVVVLFEQITPNIAHSLVLFS